MKYCYVIVWQTGGFQDLSVFTSRVAADKCFEELKSYFNLEEVTSFYRRQAFGNGKASTKTGHGSLTLMKKIYNFNSIIR